MTPATTFVLKTAIAEARASTRDEDRALSLCAALCTALGHAIAVAGKGDPKMIDRLMMCAENNIAEAATAFAPDVRALVKPH